METWNYQNPANDSTVQTDWNQTLHTKINQMTGMKPAKIYAAMKFKQLFETLLFYDKDTQLISGIYSVNYVSNIDDNCLNIEGNILEIINYK